MAYELKNGQGNSFKNANKSSENAPDWRGKIKTPDGKEWEISQWVKQSDKGEWLSIQIKEPYVKP